jgi:hypothetical protein
MKLRLQGNSVRLRLTRSEAEWLRKAGSVEESVDFGSSSVLTYRLRSRTDSDTVQADFRDGALTVSIGVEAAEAWAGSDEVGIYGQSGALTIAIEKDFRCLTRPPDDPQERDAYPHPGIATCKE